MVRENERLRDKLRKIGWRNHPISGKVDCPRHLLYIISSDILKL